ncbi:MAG: hypothetical protein K2H38_10120 [Muribaculaceae bacterium]|nr:hypothetical protein [Muribaculaceae bacterium]
MATRYLTIIIIALLISACSTETGRMLSHADSVMEEHPDSAMSILMGIDKNTLKDSEIPYYALLYTQAQVKTDVPLDSDSLISIAYAKYGDDTNGDRGIRSNFYTGEIFFNQENYREAMRYYLTAYEEAKRLNNDYWHAKAAERISNIFFFAYNYDDAAEYIIEAANYYKFVDRTRNNRFAIAQLAIILVNNNGAERAYVLLDSLKFISIKETPVDDALLDYIKLPLIDATIQTGRTLETEFDSIAFFTSDMSELETLDAAILQSQVCNALDSPEKANLEDFKDLAYSDEDKVHILYALYKNAKAAGDESLALSLVDSMLYYQNAVACDIIQESIKGAQRDFYSEKAVLNKAESLHFKRILWLSVIMSILLIALLTLIHYFKSKTQKAKLEAKIESLLSLKDHADRISREKDTLEKSLSEKDVEKSIIINRLQAVLEDKNKQAISNAEIVERLFREKWTTLDTLCDQYFGLKNSEMNSKDLISNIEKELKKVVSKKGLTQIVEATNEYMGNIVSKLRFQCPFIKEDDISFLTLLFAGFSVRAVCMFTGLKYHHFYVKKSRLIKRIEASDAPDKVLFLEKLK